MLRLINELQDAVLEEDFYRTNEVIEKIKKEQNSFEYVKFILELMEKNPNLDYGIPGPLVHFVELYYQNGYEELLLESVKRCPTSQTVWMLNRILNDPKFKEKERYLNVLNELLQKDGLTSNLKEEIRNFVRYQNEADV